MVIQRMRLGLLGLMIVLELSSSCCFCHGFVPPAARKFHRRNQGWSSQVRHSNFLDGIKEKVALYEKESSWDTVVRSCSRRESLLNILRITSGASLALVSSVFPSAAATDQETFILRLDSEQQSAGLVLKDIITKSGKSVIMIEQVVFRTQQNLDLQPGMILMPNKSYPNAKAVATRIRGGPYPIELTFTTNPEYIPPPPAPLPPSEQQFIKRTLKESTDCSIKAQRDDVLEINYEAYYLKPNAPPVNFDLETDAIMYDASALRGTGLPYQMVLGSGDMIPG